MACEIPTTPTPTPTPDISDCELASYDNTFISDYPIVIYDGDEPVPYGGGTENLDLVIALLESRVYLFQDCALLDVQYADDLYGFHLQLDHFSEVGHDS
jgi:hypothetical protein